ncbi:MAG: type II secretion system protein, partial [Patescibacteria group bacterium]
MKKFQAPSTKSQTDSPEASHPEGPDTRASCEAGAPVCEARRNSTEILRFAQDDASRHLFGIWNLEFGISPQERGFTILETVVAIVVILGAVTGPFVLATRGILSSSASKNKIIAANLAQEGIELIRAVRDNNLACDYLDGGGTDGSWAWDADPDGSGRFTTPSLNNDRVAVNSVNPAFNCGGLAGVSMVMPLFDTVSSCASPLLFNSATGRYSYSGGQATPFSRCISACSP